MASDNQHTPAPWNNKTIGIVNRPEVGFNVATLHTTNEKRREEAAANLYLIRAAPDLLGALLKAVDYNTAVHEPDEPWWVREARAALAKARGEGEDQG